MSDADKISPFMKLKILSIFKREAKKKENKNPETLIEKVHRKIKESAEKKGVIIPSKEAIRRMAVEETNRFILKHPKAIKIMAKGKLEEEINSENVRKAGNKYLKDHGDNHESS